MILAENLTIGEKLAILADAAKYDVACTSSGVDRQGSEKTVGSAAATGICHSFSADGRCISLLKILFTNECIFDCKYCMNRCSNDVPRATFTPEEVCKLTMEFYRRNYIEGLFLSSGVFQTPDRTMELMVKTLMMLREDFRFGGYIHCKAIPGASPELVEAAGWYADRMSVNLELPTAEGLKVLAPHKNRRSILNPMRQIQEGILQSRELFGRKGGSEGVYRHTWNWRKGLTGTGENKNRLTYELSRPKNFFERGFVPAGQSSQMIIGATNESDYQILSVAEALYQKFDLKRVFYSAFVRVNEDKELPVLPGGPPLLREHRLYQADWLLRYYGFEADELLSEKHPNFNAFLDPKCDWAVNHLECFPVEVSGADLFLLLRVPGIGMKSARRIIEARKHGRLTFESLKKMGVVLKRAGYFITCYGKLLMPIRLEEDEITRKLLEGSKTGWRETLGSSLTYRQLSLFDDTVFLEENRADVSFSADGTTRVVSGAGREEV